MSRATQIQTHLDDYFHNTFHIAVSTPTSDVWATLVEEFGPSAQFGWASPLPYDAPPWMVPYCPEIIAEQTKDLSDEELDDYLNVIKWDVGGHILHWDDETDPDVRRGLSVAEMYEEYPGSVVVWDRVQLAVLDRANS